MNFQNKGTSKKAKSNLNKSVEPTFNSFFSRFCQLYLYLVPSRNLRRFINSVLLSIVLTLSLITGHWLVETEKILQSYATGPVDAILVLGGSIHREIYAAELAKQNPKIPILISQGSPEPCIWLIFNHAQAPTAQVLLEKCAKSTFDNFYFSIPILQKWQVHKIKVITSSSHLPRAKWLAQIMLGSQRIWVEIKLVKGKGTPGNRESWLKTALDLTRATVWSVTSNFLMKPECNSTINLSSVDMELWHHQGFICEYKGSLVKE